MRFVRHSVLFILIFFVSPVFTQTDAAATKPEELKSWILTLKNNPGDVQALRNIGVYCFENGKLPISAKCWGLVYRKDPSDPQALYFLGRLLEAKKRPDQALKFYGKYGQIPKTSAYRDLMEGRYRLLSRDQVKREMRLLLDQENLISQEPPSPKTVAVFPFQYHGQNPKISPLGKGLAEMLITDLSQISDIKVVERVRVQALLDEVKLGETGLVKAGNSPILGKMLKAGKMIIGHFTIQDKGRVAVETSYLDALQNVEAEPLQLNDALNNMLLLEKDIAFKVIDRMGIRLTPQEKERIQRIPTRNMLAFANYCMGLETQDRGEFGKAAEFYGKALQLDPGYSMAKQKIGENQLVLTAQSGALPVVQPESSPEKHGKQFSPERVKSVVDRELLINNRLKTINVNIGSNFKPGIDSRKASQEATESGAYIGISDLPIPPQPPTYQVP